MILAALLLPAAVSAASGEVSYQSGVDSFESGDYRQALAYFLEAEAQGLDSPALHYNLGAVHYRLGSFQKARRHFLRSAESAEMAPLSYYNLALTAVKIGDHHAAVRWAERAVEDSDNPHLRGLAAELLNRLGAEPAFAGPVSNWQGFFSGALGHDDNVLLVSDDTLLTNSETSDYFIDLFGHLSLTGIDGPGATTFELDGSAWLLEHYELNDYDTLSLKGGGSLEGPVGTWTAVAGAHSVLTLLAGNPFTRESLFSLQLGRPLDSGRLRLRYQLGRISALDDDYRYLDGWKQKLDARWSWRQRRTRWRLYYQFETNDRDDLTDPLFTSYSPTRNAVSLIARTPLIDTVEFRGELRYDHSYYRDPNQLGGGGSATRRDDRIDVSAELSRPLRDDIELSFEYRYTDNDSNLAVYDYSRHRLLLGVLVMF